MKFKIKHVDQQGYAYWRGWNAKSMQYEWHPVKSLGDDYLLDHARDILNNFLTDLRVGASLTLERTA